MEETLISFKTVKLAKEKGFDGSIFIKIGKLKQPSNWHKEQSNITEVWYFNITQSLLQKWLREEHNLFLSIDKQIYSTKYWWFIDFKGKDTYSLDQNEWDTYEEALEQGLYQALKLITNEQR